MADPANLEELDRLGDALASLGWPSINLSCQRDARGAPYFFVDGKRDGRFFSGMGAKPSAALAASEHFTAIAKSGGVHVDQVSA